jgi:hypothetical protein
MTAGNLLAAAGVLATFAGVAWAGWFTLGQHQANWLRVAVGLTAVAVIFLGAGIVADARGGGASAADRAGSHDDPPTQPTTSTVDTSTPTSSPAAASQPSATSVPPPTAPEAFLYEIQEYQVVSGPGIFQTGSYVVNGTTYARSVAFPAPCGQYPEEVDFVLSRRFSTLVATIGLSDDSGADARVQFDVVADGVRVGGPYELTIGEQEDIRLALGNPVRLRLTATNVGGCNDYFVENGIAVWGDAKLIP